MEWQLTDGDLGMLSVHVDRQANAIHLWTADSAIRDFRKAEWSSQPLEIDRGSSQTRVVVDKPATGYRAFMGEVVFTASTGHDYKLSTPVQVLPDDVK